MNNVNLRKIKELYNFLSNQQSAIVLFFIHLTYYIISININLKSELLLAVLKCYYKNFCLS